MPADLFQKRPVETITYTLHHTADFAGVDSLLPVSLCVHAVFKANSFQIIHDLLKSLP